MEQLVLVFLHVTSGFLWAAGVVVQAFWVIPSVLEAGPSGGPVIAGIMKRRFVLVMTSSSLLAVLTGLRLYSIRFSTAWVASAEGVVLTLGLLLAIGGLVIGMFRQRPLAERMAAISAAVRASGGPPSAEQAQELAALGPRLARVAKVGAFHLIAVVVLMAAHRLAATFV
jgi:hypothetical protein